MQLKAAIIINDISDHLPIFTQTKIIRPVQLMDKVPTYEKRIINEITKGDFSNSLSAADWTDVYTVHVIKETRPLHIQHLLKNTGQYTNLLFPNQVIH